MNTVELSEKIRDHLVNQGSKSSGCHGTCLYRGPNGKMCAVGCLIKFKHYDKAIEHLGLFTDPVLTAIEQSIGRPLTQVDVDILWSWQKYHDNICYFDSNGISQYSYIEWLQCQQEQSPGIFHNALMKEFEGSV